jgi:ribonuclease E
VQVVLVANPLLETPHFDVRRIRDDQIDMPENSGVSYALKNLDTEPESPQAILERKAIEPAAIAVLKPSTPAPKPKVESTGLWAWLGSLFAGSGDAKKSSSAGRRSTRETRDGRTRNAPQGRSRPEHRRTDESRKQNRKKAGKAGKKAAARDSNRPQKDAENKQQQQQKPQKPLPQDGAAGSNDDAQNAEKKPARSRRSRGGRRRRRGSAADRPSVENTPAQNLSEQEAQAQFARQQIAREADAGKGSAPPEADRSSSEATTEAGAKKTPRPRRKPKADKPAAESALAAANDTPALDLADTHPNLQSPAFANQKPVSDLPVKSDTSGNGSTEMKPQQKPEVPAAPKPGLPESPQPEAAPARKPEGRLLPWDNEQG